MLLFHAHHQSILADREPDAGRGNLRPQPFGQPIVASAAKHRILRAQRPVHNLERSAHVVIQPAHHSRLDFVGNAAIVQIRPHGGEMPPARFAQMILDGRQRVDNVLVLGNLAVQHTQRIRLGPALAIAAQLRRHVAKFFLQQSHILRPAILIAHRVQIKLEAGEPHAPKQFHHHLDHFGIHGGRFRADRLRANLIKLAVATLLRPFAPEHRSDIVQLLQAGNLIQAMLDVGAHHRRGGFRPQRERTAVAIFECVHLFAHDVGLFADAARKQRRLFQDWRADLLVVVLAKDLARNRFHVVPGGAGRRKNIARAFYGFDHRS